VDKLKIKIKTMKNDKASDFVKWLLKPYDKYTCTLFFNIYEKIMDDLGTKSLFGGSFFYKL
jgi:hypothetical protein